MKHLFIIMLFLFMTSEIWAQEPKQIAVDEFPSDQPINYISDWGDMTVAVNNIPAGTDLAPLLDGLKNNSCQVPHWGFIQKGSLKLTYDDGTEQTLRAGDVFYMPPGHIAIVLEDLTIMDFSPSRGFEKLMKHINKKIEETN